MARVGKLSGVGALEQAGVLSPRVAEEQSSPKDLQFLMNTGAEAIAKQQRMGGFPMPSLAITRQDLPFDSFGNITLVGRPENFDPKASKKNVVYDADAYTVRAPQPFRIAKKDADIAFTKKYKSIADEFGEPIDGTSYELAQQETKKYAHSGRFNDVRRFFDTDIVADIAFLREQGVANIPMREGRVDLAPLRDLVRQMQTEKDAWANRQMNEYFQGEEVFDASTNRDFVTGKGLKLRPYTADEVLRFMKKSRGAAQEDNAFSTGPGALRASVTERLRNLKEIKNKRGKLVGKDEFELFKNQSYDDVHELSDSLGLHYKFDSNKFGFENTVIDMLIESERIGLDKALNEFGFEDIPDYLIDEISDVKRKFREAPTEYFEAKPERIVDLQEFEGAIVPVDTPKETLDALKNAGVKVETYGDATERLNKRKKFAGTAFSIGGGMVLVGSGYSPEAPAMPVDDAIPDWQEIYGSEVNTEMPPSSFDNKLEAARALGAGFTGGILGDLSRIGGYINPFSDVESVDADAVALQNQVVRALSGGKLSPGAQKYLEPIQQVDEAQVGTLSAIDRAMRVGGEEEADQYLKRQFPRGYGIVDVLNQYINPLSY